MSKTLKSLLVTSAVVMTTVLAGTATSHAQTKNFESFAQPYVDRYMGSDADSAAGKLNTGSLKKLSTEFKDRMPKLNTSDTGNSETATIKIDKKGIKRMLDRYMP